MGGIFKMLLGIGPILLPMAIAGFGILFSSSDNVSENYG
jgi:hypothetical protein